MTKRPHLVPFLVLAGATLLAGCGTRNRGLESVHQPVVTRSEAALDLQAGYDGLVAGEAARLAGWMDALRLGYGDTVTIDDPTGAARAEVAAVAAGRGLLLADAAPSAGEPVSPGTVRVIVAHTRAAVPGCPDYSRSPSRNFDAHTSSNYGCAVNANLAVMVANPIDLVRGATGGGDYDGQIATRAIAELKAAKPTGAGGTTLPDANAGGSKSGGR